MAPKASGETGTFMKHLKSWMHILLTERYANYKTSMDVNKQLLDWFN